jgi:hypothetical protein
MEEVQATEEAFSPQKEYPALQHMTFLHIFYFCGSFFPRWIHIQPTKISTLRILCGIRSHNLGLWLRIQGANERQQVQTVFM